MYEKLHAPHMQFDAVLCARCGGGGGWDEVNVKWGMSTHAFMLERGYTVYFDAQAKGQKHLSDQTGS